MKDYSPYTDRGHLNVQYTTITSTCNLCLKQNTQLKLNVVCMAQNLFNDAISLNKMILKHVWIAFFCAFANR